MWRSGTTQDAMEVSLLSFSVGKGVKAIKGSAAKSQYGSFSIFPVQHKWDPQNLHAIPKPDIPRGVQGYITNIAFCNHIPATKDPPGRWEHLL